MQAKPPPRETAGCGTETNAERRMRGIEHDIGREPDQQLLERLPSDLVNLGFPPAAGGCVHCPKRRCHGKRRLVQGGGLTI